MAAGLTVATAIVFTATAWACVPMATMQAAPSSVQAGQQVTVSGIRFLGLGPVTIRLNTLDGPVLATAPMGLAANTIFQLSVTIPPDTPPGPAVLVATQQVEPGAPVPWGVPARTLVTVTGPDGGGPQAVPAEEVGRPRGLARASVSTGAFVLVGLGTAAAALLAAAALALVAGRDRSPAAATAPKEVR